MSPELSESDLERLKARLDELRRELSELLSIGAGGDDTVDLDLPIGRLTRVDALQQQQMAKEGRRRLEIRLRQVDAAIGAWNRGEYGECHNCGDTIGLARLEARPESPRCIACQDELESNR